VLEALLIGSIRSELELSSDEECAMYRALLGELARRVEQRARCSG
jgi:hypothetical protein